MTNTDEQTGLQQLLEIRDAKALPAPIQELLDFDLKAGHPPTSPLALPEPPRQKSEQGEAHASRGD
jgi:hypothetical protein